MIRPRAAQTRFVALSILLTSCVVALPHQAFAGNSFDDARSAFLQGDFDTARSTYETLAESKQNRLRAVIGLTEIDLMVGDYEKGIERLQTVESQGRKSAAWHAAIAELLAEIGKYDDAIAHNRRALDLDEQHYQARCQLGLYLEEVGRTDEAIRAYKPFEDTMLGGEVPETPEDITYLGIGFYRYSLLTQNPNLAARTRHVLQELYQDAFDNIDPLYWPARLAAADLLLEKHNTKEAETDIQNLVKQHSHVADAHVAMGYLELGGWEFDAVEQCVEDAQRCNPRSVAAILLLADCRMLEERYADAIETAEAALGINPNSIEALTTIAAARIALGDSKAAQQIQKRVEKINPRPAMFHYGLGLWYTTRRQFSDAETEYKKANKFAPWWPEPLTDLGLCYLETGEESLAKRTLEASFKLDGFNHRTHTTLMLLDKIERLASVETDHFIVKFDKEQDAIIGIYFPQALEAMYDEVCDSFSHHPTKKTIIELLPNHMDFSLRIGGRPFVATVGACSGRVIVMSSPRIDTGVFGLYDWDTVLRHEFAHTVTLDATENRISHWFTEACAVSSEPIPLPWGHRNLLSQCYREGRLFSLEEIDLGFIRPRRHDSRAQAYAQSEWMLEYIIEEHGKDKIEQLLNAYRDEPTQEAVFEKALGMSTTEFFDAFKKWAGKRVAAWDLPTYPCPDKEEIEKKLENDPDNASLLVQLAYALIDEDEFDKAEEIARKVMSIDPKEKTAFEIYVHIQIARSNVESDPEEQKKRLGDVEFYLRRLLQLDPENQHAILYMGYVEQSRSHWNEAVKWLTRYQQRYPDDPDACRRLADVFREMGNEAAHMEQLGKLALMTDRHPDVALLLAKHCENTKRTEAAAKWYRHAIGISLFDASTHLSYGNALLSLGRLSEAKQEFEAAVALEPDEGAAYDGLRRVFATMGNQKQAEAYKKKAEARGFRPETEPAEHIGR